VQERQTALKKLEAKISRQAKTVTAIADLDLTRSRIMAKLHRDTDPLKRGTSQLLKMSPTVLKSIKSNLEEKKQPYQSGKSHKPVLPIPPHPQEQSGGHLPGISDDKEGEGEERRKKRVDVDSLVTPRRNVRKWERELVGLVKDKKKREEVASGAKTERRMHAFKPPSKDEMKRLSMQAAVDLGYSSEGEEEEEEPGGSKRRLSQRRRRSSTSIVLEEDSQEGGEGKDGKAGAGEADKGEKDVHPHVYIHISFRRTRRIV
jgi:hypothetical protein